MKLSDLNNSWKAHSDYSDSPNLKVDQVDRSQVVTDFGIVCLLYSDPEQIFLKCWNRERTVGQQKRFDIYFDYSLV